MFQPEILQAYLQRIETAWPGRKYVHPMRDIQGTAAVAAKYLEDELPSEKAVITALHEIHTGGLHIKELARMSPAYQRALKGLSAPPPVAPSVAVTLPIPLPVKPATAVKAPLRIAPKPVRAPETPPAGRSTPGKVVTQYRDTTNLPFIGDITGFTSRNGRNYATVRITGGLTRQDWGAAVGSAFPGFWLSIVLDTGAAITSGVSSWLGTGPGHTGFEFDYPTDADGKPRRVRAVYVWTGNASKEVYIGQLALPGATTASVAASLPAVSTAPPPVAPPAPPKGEVASPIPAEPAAGVSGAVVAGGIGLLAVAALVASQALGGGEG